MTNFGHLRSQIEIVRIFSIVGVFSSLKRCYLKVDNLDKLVIIYKNQPIDAQNDCNLVDGQKVAELFVVKQILLEENEDMPSEIFELFLWIPCVMPKF